MTRAASAEEFTLCSGARLFSKNALTKQWLKSSPCTSTLLPQVTFNIHQKNLRILYGNTIMEAQDLLLLVRPHKDLNPPVTRVLSVPPFTNFHDLLLAIKATFGYSEQDTSSESKTSIDFVDECCFFIVDSTPSLAFRVNELRTRCSTEIHVVPSIQDYPQQSINVLLRIQKNNSEPCDIGYLMRRKMTDVKVGDIFNNYEYRGAFAILSFTAHDKDFVHTIFTLGTTPITCSEPTSQITLLGGQGTTSRQGVKQSRSSSSIDIPSLRKALEQQQPGSSSPFPRSRKYRSSDPQPAPHPP